MELGSDLWHQMDKAATANDPGVLRQRANLRNQADGAADLKRIAADDIETRGLRRDDEIDAMADRSRGMREGAEELGAAAGTIGAGVLAARLAGNALDNTGGTEDLKAETNGAPPEVMTTPDPINDRKMVAMLIRKLNDMRKAAGGEVPEAPAMEAEINRLLSQVNQRVNDPNNRPARNEHGQAQALRNKLNAMRSAAGGEVPEAPAIMAEMQRLQAIGDAKRNAYQTGHL
jgi:hypothetical protein